MPKFSIIVGVYNQLGTLPGLVDSLQRQTFKDFEVHFCDDGSDDGSREYLEGNQAWGFQSYVHVQEHKGMRLAKNLNQGVVAAQGEYCLFVMADSLLETDYLEILQEYVRPNNLVCGVRVQLDSIDGKLEGVDIDWRVKKGVVPEVPSVVLSMPWLCLTGNGLTIPTDALHATGGWDEQLEGYGGEDNEIVARFYFQGFLCWSVPDLRLYHMWHKSQETNPASAEHTINKIESYAA